MPTTDKTTSSINLPVPRLLLERLEYGKLCVTPDGPTISETVEHRHLGWTIDFPPDLKPLCVPTWIGISLSEFDEFPRQCPHGTVLRPVGLRGQVMPILCRVRARPEKGEGTEGRLYTLARYLVAPHDKQVEPSGLLKAMGPLRGMTEYKLGSLEPFEAEISGEYLDQRLESDEFRLQARRFVKEALIYVMSGIPVSIANHIEEEEFFALVTALWRLLPSWLRPYLSAGWGVSASLSGKLAVTHAWRQADFCASFSRGSDGKWKWAPPREAPGHGKRAREPFQRRHVTTGAHYVSYVFGCEPYSLPKIADFNEQPRAEELLGDRLPDGYGSLVKPLDFDDPAVAGLFIAPGLDARDRHLFKEWERYLAVRVDEDGNNLVEPTSDFTFKARKREAFNLLREAFGDVQRRKQADALLWRLVSSADPDLSDLNDEEDHFGAARLRLFKAICGGDSRELLEALYQSAAVGGAYRLPVGAREAMRQPLRFNLRSFDPEQARLHVSLLDLNMDQQPLDYADWVKQYAFEIALSARGSMNEWAEALYQRIKLIPDSHIVRMLLSWEDGKEPTPEDGETFHGLDAELRRWFFDQLVSRWGEYLGKHSAARREKLLPWLRLAWYGQAVDDPLLALVFGKKPGVSDLPQLATAVEMQAAAPSLERPLARLTLKHYIELSQRIHQDVKKWSSVLRYWPADVLEALFPNTGLRSDANEGIAEDYFEADQLKFSAEELEKLIRSSSLAQPAALRWYWRWAKDCLMPHPKSQTPIVQVCKYIWGTGTLPEGPDLRYSDIERARRLAEADGESLSALKSKVEAVWRRKDKEIVEVPEKWLELSHRGFMPLHRRQYFQGEYDRIAREMLVLLYFYPDVDFIPTTQQLDILLNYQDEVRSHLKSKEAVHPNRFRRFRLITAQPMELNYPGSQDTLWKDEYAKSHFWIVFKGVPIRKQHEGMLKHSLDFYYGAPQDRHWENWKLDEVVSVCREYFESYRGTERKEAAKRVLGEFVIPWLRFCYQWEKEKIKERLLGRSAPMIEWGTRPFWALVDDIKSVLKDKVIAEVIADKLDI
jgi:hypothetical protein